MICMSCVWQEVPYGTIEVRSSSIRASQIWTKLPRKSPQAGAEAGFCPCEYSKLLIQPMAHPRPTNQEQLIFESKNETERSSIDSYIILKQGKYTIEARPHQQRPRQPNPSSHFSQDLMRKPQTKELRINSKRLQKATTLKIKVQYQSANIVAKQPLIHI